MIYTEENHLKKYMFVFGLCHSEVPPIGLSSCPTMLVKYLVISSGQDRTTLDHVVPFHMIFNERTILDEYQKKI